MAGSRGTTVVASGFLLPECPRWHDGALWFVDMLQGSVNRLCDGVTETVARFDRPSAVGFRPDGAMIVADGTKRLVHVLEHGSVVESIDLSSSVPQLNDMAISRQGWAYIDAFGDSGGLAGAWTPSGSIVLVTFDSTPRIVAENLVAPNGIGISADGTTLVVGEAMGRGEPLGARLVAFAIAKDGSLSKKHTVGMIARGLGDGLCIDAEGAVWVGTAFGHEAQRFLNGELVDRVQYANRRWALACALGGSEMSTLYTCTTSARRGGDPSDFSDGWIEATEVAVPGIPTSEREGRDGNPQ